MELICGACRGRLLAEFPGTTVACPHCGTHLQTPPATSASTLPPPALDLGDGHSCATDSEGDTVKISVPVQNAGPLQAGSTAENPKMAATVAMAPFAKDVDTALIEATTTPGMKSTVPEIPPGYFAEVTGEPAPATDSSVPPDRHVNLDGTADREHRDQDAAVVQGVVSYFATENLRTDAAMQHEQPVAAVFPAAEMAFAVPDAEMATGEPAMVAVGRPLMIGDEGSAQGTSVSDADRRSGATRRVGVSPIAFLLVASYASAMTLACLFLAYLLKNNPRTLDLPDLAPPVAKDKRKVTSMIYLPPEKEIPMANILKLGETRRFGSLNVTPLRVTRGLVEFRFYNGDADEKKEAEGPVLKLHLRFENVSQDQEFIPLDGRLVYTKEVDRKIDGAFKANNFVCNVANRNRAAGRVYVFDHVSPGGMWLLKDQHLDQELAPGQILETFVPTTAEEIESLKGDLVWRVHFRKGYNRTSFRGVTTLIEVLFHGSDIVDDPPVPVETPATDPRHDPASEEPTTEEATVREV